MNYYIVKINWSTVTDNISNEFDILDAYSGLGGDIWPLFDSSDYTQKRFHDEFKTKQEYIDLNNGTSELVCFDLNLAKNYHTECKKYFDDVFLLELCEYNNLINDGLDFGSPDGGYSIIESAIIMKEDMASAKKYLNPFGLFKYFKSYLEFRLQLNNNETEELDSYSLLSIKCLMSNNIGDRNTTF
ncbi:hypothetical protein MNBD_GAMMA12-92 [hydrothermal vent metagenome]|uniref:Uncharacterized protein n=1 Tax=hydrothermal vent metagenome TaxID=652676 RepID=A0A3B0Z772_9ZZZZ